MREINYQISVEQKVVGFCVALLVLVTLGPFGTYDTFSLFGRISYWSVMLLTVGVVIETASYAAINSRYLHNWPVAACLALAVIVSSVPATSVVIFVDRVFRDSTLSPDSFPRLYWQVVLLAYAISMVDYYLWRRVFDPKRVPQDTQAPLHPAPTLPRLYAKLPSEAQHGDIISLSMQDHYVEVTTTTGAYLVLMRLGDAIDLLDGVAGSQTHRSHWAAQAHMAEITRTGQKATLHLSDDRELPVSTRYLEQVQALIDA